MPEFIVLRTPLAPIVQAQALKVINLAVIFHEVFEFCPASADLSWRRCSGSVLINLRFVPNGIR